jgi:hypothetical protein
MWARGAALGFAVLVGSAARPALANPPAALHPLHTTLTELSYDPSTRVLNVTMRVFTDDFSAAVLPRGRGGADVVPPDSAMLRYVTERFAVAPPGTRPAALRWCGVRRDGEVLFLCLRATDQGSPAGGRMRNALLSEVFADQVNIVQASYGGGRRTLLFTPRDGTKTLP